MAASIASIDHSGGKNRVAYMELCHQRSSEPGRNKQFRRIAGDDGFGTATRALSPHSAANRNCIIALIKSEFATFVFELGGRPALKQWPEFTLNSSDDGYFRHS